MKSYTDLEQSKILAEILPIESADMHYVLIDTDKNKYSAGLGKYIGILPHYPCWSLAALLEVLNEEITDSKGDDYALNFEKKYSQYQIYYYKCWKEDIETDYYYNMVDAAYEMILKLHEFNLL